MVVNSRFPSRVNELWPLFGWLCRRTERELIRGQSSFVDKQNAHQTKLSRLACSTLVLYYLHSDMFLSFTVNRFNSKVEVCGFYAENFRWLVGCPLSLVLKIHVDDLN